MARCPKKGEGKGGSSSSAPPGFAAYAGVDEYEGHSTFLARDRVAGTEDGDRSKRVSFPTIADDDQRGNVSGAPRPPWEDDESFELPAPSGYMVFSGEDADQNGVQHVFMIREGQDPLQASDPWHDYTSYVPVA